MLKRIIRKFKQSAGIYESRADGTYGLLAEFSDPGALLHAAEEVHDAGYRRFDTYSPFPVHGMSRAMGLGNAATMGLFTLGGGLTGLAIGTWMQWWMGGVDYPLNISGKPFFAWWTSVPIMFELTVLLASFGALIGMLLMNGLPRLYNPLFYSERFARVTDDGFFLCIAARDEHYHRERTEDLLRKTGALAVEVIKEDGAMGRRGDGVTTGSGNGETERQRVERTER